MCRLAGQRRNQKLPASLPLGVGILMNVPKRTEYQGTTTSTCSIAPSGVVVQIVAGDLTKEHRKCCALYNMKSPFLMSDDEEFPTTWRFQGEEKIT